MTDTSRDYRPIAYVIILLGVATAAVAALVPQHAIGFRLEVAVLLALLTPFVLYGALTESLRGLVLLLPGLILLGVNLALLVYERFLSFDGYASGLVYWLPLTVAVVVLPLAYWFRGGSSG
jgi:Zn-dependent protease with chaperone function